MPLRGTAFCDLTSGAVMATSPWMLARSHPCRREAVAADDVATTSRLRDATTSRATGGRCVGVDEGVGMLSDRGDPPDPGARPPGRRSALGGRPEHALEQDVGARLAVLPAGVLDLHVAAAADAGHEDHRRRPERRPCSWRRGRRRSRGRGWSSRGAPPSRAPARPAPARTRCGPRATSPRGAARSRGAPRPPGTPPAARPSRAARGASSQERMSTVKWAPPGTTLREFGCTWISPTVATRPPPILAGMPRTATIISAAATSASARPSIGVVPTWLAVPSTCTSYQCRHTMPRGTPMVLPSRSRRGPCSTCSS